jgi:hypothetical protein
LTKKGGDPGLARGLEEAGVMTGGPKGGSTLRTCAEKAAGDTRKNAIHGVGARNKNARDKVNGTDGYLDKSDAYLKANSNQTTPTGQPAAVGLPVLGGTHYPKESGKSSDPWP